MSDHDNNVIYRYEPHFEGEFFYGIPARDLTQADVDRLGPFQQRDAFAPHPGYGTPLYVKVGTDPEPPKWFATKQADAGDAPIEPMLLGETKAQYEDRIAAIVAADEAPDVEPGEDGTA